MSSSAADLGSSERALGILRRFPAHLDLARPRKLVSAVVEGIVPNLEGLSTELSRVRRAHRLGHADTLRDVLALAALHGIGPAELRVLFSRAEAVLARARALGEASAAHDAPARDVAAAALFDLWGTLAPEPRLQLFAVPESDPAAPELDLDAAALSLVSAARATVDYRALLTATRARVAEICSIHARGNGTVGALLRGCANALDLDIDEGRNRAVKKILSERANHEVDLSIEDSFFHSRDRFWHSSFVVDRLQPAPRAEPLGPIPEPDEVLGIEENPLAVESTRIGPTLHGARFSTTRRGFGTRILNVEMTGIADRSVGPMFVNVDEGRGFGFSGSVPDGKKLTLTEEGRIELDGADVTAFGYAFAGACFADSASRHGLDFVFDGETVSPARRATFVRTSPLLTLDREATFPGAGDSLSPPGIGVGVTRFAFFVQVAHFAAREPLGSIPPVHTPTPRTAIAFADASVFAAPPIVADAFAADLKLSWHEHRAYAVRVYIPRRFGALDGAEENVPAHVRRALERFRPLGVEVEVVYQDDRWRLGEGRLPADESDDPNLRLLGGSVLWPTDGGS